MNRDNYGMKYFMVELKRGVTRRNFWFVIIGLFLFSLVYQVTIDMPILISYYTTKNPTKYIHGTSLQAWCNFLISALGTTFLPIFAAIVNNDSLVTDLKTGYAKHVYYRTGFKKFFISKLFASCMLSGIAIFTAIYLLNYALIPFYGHFSQANIVADNSDQLVMMINNKMTIFSNAHLYVLIKSLMVLIVAILFSYTSFAVSLFTNNLLIIYTLPMLVYRVYEVIIYYISKLIGQFTHKPFGDYYSMISIYSDLGGFYNITTDLKLYLFLFIIITVIVIVRYKTLYNSLFSAKQGEEVYEF